MSTTSHYPERPSGLSVSVVSDVDGNYTITVPDDPDTTRVVCRHETPESRKLVSHGTEFHPGRGCHRLGPVVVNGVFERKANTFTGSVRLSGKMT